MSDNDSIFPEQYRQVIEAFLTAYWFRRSWEVRETVLGVEVPPVQPEVLFHSGFAHNLALIARAAAGELPLPAAGQVLAGDVAEGEVEELPPLGEAGDMVRYEVAECIQDLAERLFAPPGLYNSYTIPAEFWDHPLGQMVARAQIWLKGDELITLSRAATLLGVTTQAVSQAMEKGRLTRYVDPDAANPQKGRVLASREEVARYKEEREGSAAEGGAADYP